MPIPDSFHDPCGPPTAVEKGSCLADLIVLVLAGGVLLFILAIAWGPTMGSTRSAHIQWEQRMQQTAEAARE
jgi:hypothetical protein